MGDLSMIDVLGLSVERRLQIVHQIWQSIVDTPDSLPVTDAERLELDRRLESHRKDPASARSWDEVKARLLREACIAEYRFGPKRRNALTLGAKTAIASAIVAISPPTA